MDTKNAYEKMHFPGILANTALILCLIFSYQAFGNIFFIWIMMFFSLIQIGIYTISGPASIVEFVTIDNLNNRIDADNRIISIRLLQAAVYMTASFQIAAAGFTFFAGAAFIAALMHLLTNIFGWLKVKDKNEKSN